ncbi:MAG: YbjN domain-containing protein [Candidatus Aenigmarchaeota archaeon]|nr:YbjN domain-containing protein [Candidatus Aenigmarchaeota archaeon]
MGSKKVEGYMINLDLTFQEIAENSWQINDEGKGLEKIIVIYEEPLVIIRVKVMKLPDTNLVELYETLLKYNASDLIHGAYALEGDHVILIDSLESASMDLEEFQASLDAIGLALAQHYPILSKYRNKK